MTTASHFSLLVVDDEPDLRTLYELTLLREGYDMDTAGTVQLYGESPTRPMWIRLRTIDGGVETILIGAVPGYDTTFARKQADTRDTTNTLRPR